MCTPALQKSQWLPRRVKFYATLGCINLGADKYEKYPFLEEIGIKELYAKAGEAELAVDLKEKHSTSWGSMHGAWQ